MLTTQNVLETLIAAQCLETARQAQDNHQTLYSCFIRRIFRQQTIEKLYRTGLTTLDTLYLAKRDDLAVATGIPASLSERICDKFQAYRTRLESSSRSVSGERDRLALMLGELRMHHEAFQHASSNEWSNPALAAGKRDCRQQRQSCALWINILLAEIGELDLINELEKLSFERRIERLEKYLASMPASI